MFNSSTIFSVPNPRVLSVGSLHSMHVSGSFSENPQVNDISVDFFVYGIPGLHRTFCNEESIRMTGIQIRLNPVDSE